MKLPRFRRRKPDTAIPEYRTASRDHVCDSPYDCQGIAAGARYLRRATPGRRRGNPDKHFDHELWCRRCAEFDGLWTETP